MKLIVGLGNPGEKYKNNRHNVGYMVADKLKTQMSKVKNVIVLKTNTFVNNSGTAVKKFLSRYSLPTTNLYVIHDDLDIALGDYKIQYAKGPKVHGGIANIEQNLSSKNFWRIRVGVDNRKPEERTMGEKYVLQDFTDDETKILSDVIKEVVKDLMDKITMHD